MIRLHRLAITLALLGICRSASAQDIPLESGVLAELNQLRANPRMYAQKLRAYRALIGADRIRHDPGDAVGKITFEGVVPVDEAIVALQNQPPLPPLAMNAELAKVARAYAIEQGRTGGFGHVSAGGATMSMRIGRGHVVYGSVAETISYGEHTPADVVRQLVVDDGVPNRGHRRILLTAGLKYVGVGCAAHAQYHIECVEDYSELPVPPVR